ncbi:MAG: sugar-binding domain-containing protein [Chloroflexota bacterium]
MSQLLSAPHSENLRPEHPRPYFQRPKWVNLNGPWDFSFDEELIGEQSRWYLPAVPFSQQLTIHVPFPWESKLSGVERSNHKGAGWYQREVTIPAEWGDLVPYLNFEAVDWHARVWINGELAAEHENGYLPFSVDLSPYAKAGESVTVTVRAFDIAEASTLVGKQVPFWYTHSSGIWQTVWLEGRAPNHVTSIQIAPDVANRQAHATINVACSAPSNSTGNSLNRATLRICSKYGDFETMEAEVELAEGASQHRLSLAIPNVKLWSPESPYLYEVDVSLISADGGTDQVATYFGMRTITTGAWNGNEYEYILLNDEPVYLRGALDQAFHPDGVHSYPTDEIIRGDIQLAKDLGLNMLRCHIKINDPRYYYWADKLGLLVMYDLPSPVIDSPAMRKIIVETLHRVMERDYNSPSIIAWIIFNETWGLTKLHTAEAQAWLAEVVELTRKLDPTRLVEDNSVCKYDHVETDINSWHYYINDYGRVRQHIQRVVDETYPGSSFNYVGGDYVQKTAPLMNSEYGGIAARSGDTDIAWCFKYQTSELRRHNKICGYVYTELDDIEWEHNGFVNYDRSKKEFGYDFFVEGMSVADLNGADLVGVDAPPCQTLSPGSTFRAPLFVSHWGASMSSSQVRWQLDFIDRFGQKSTIQEQAISIGPARFAVTDGVEIDTQLPNENGLATLALWLEDEHGAIRSRNYVNIEVRGKANPLAEKTADGWAIRLLPGFIQQTNWEWLPPYMEPSGAKFAATGSGWVEYEVVLPDGLALADVTQLDILFEAGSKAGGAKIDWPQRTYGLQYPQTEEDKKWASDLVVSINGSQIGEAHLSDDPADARGVLSHHRSIDPGAHGFLLNLTMAKAELAQLMENVGSGKTVTIRFEIPTSASHQGGLSLYGETLGCFPVGPTLMLSTAG